MVIFPGCAVNITVLSSTQVQVGLGVVSFAICDRRDRSGGAPTFVLHLYNFFSGVPLCPVLSRSTEQLSRRVLLCPACPSPRTNVKHPIHFLARALWYHTYNFYATDQYVTSQSCKNMSTINLNHRPPRLMTMDDSTSHHLGHSHRPTQPPASLSAASIIYYLISTSVRKPCATNERRTECPCSHTCHHPMQRYGAKKNVLYEIDITSKSY